MNTVSLCISKCKILPKKKISYIQLYVFIILYKKGHISIGCLTLSATCFKHVFPQPRRSRPRDDTWQRSEASYGGRIWALPQRTGSFWLKDGGEKGFSCWPRLNTTPTRSFQHTCIETWVMYGNVLNTRMHLQKWGRFVPSISGKTEDGLLNLSWPLPHWDLQCLQDPLPAPSWYFSLLFLTPKPSSTNRHLPIAQICVYIYNIYIYTYIYNYEISPYSRGQPPAKKCLKLETSHCLVLRDRHLLCRSQCHWTRKHRSCESTVSRWHEPVHTCFKQSDNITIWIYIYPIIFRGVGWNHQPDEHVAIDFMGESSIWT